MAFGCYKFFLHRHTFWRNLLLLDFGTYLLRYCRVGNCRVTICRVGNCRSKNRKWKIVLLETVELETVGTPKFHIDMILWFLHVISKYVVAVTWLWLTFYQRSLVKTLKPLVVVEVLYIFRNQYIFTKFNKKEERRSGATGKCVSQKDLQLGNTNNE